MTDHIDRFFELRVKEVTKRFTKKNEFLLTEIRGLCGLGLLTTVSYIGTADMVVRMPLA